MLGGLLSGKSVFLHFDERRSGYVWRRLGRVHRERLHGARQQARQQWRPPPHQDHHQDLAQDHLRHPQGRRTLQVRTSTPFGGNFFLGGAGGDMC